MIYKGDVISAFCRLHYHPDVASAYTFVLGTYLVIPVSMVFGYRYPPSLFYLFSKLRSFTSRFVHHLPLS